MIGTIIIHMYVYVYKNNIVMHFMYYNLTGYPLCKHKTYSQCLHINEYKIPSRYMLVSSGWRCNCFKCHELCWGNKKLVVDLGLYILLEEKPQFRVLLT